MADRRRHAIDLGHVVFVLVIAVVTALYLWDVLDVSTRMNNVILVLPLAILLLILCAVIISTSVLFGWREAYDEAVEARAASEQSEALAAGPNQSGGDVRRALVMLAGLGAYTFSYDVIGLDVATFLFVAGSLLLLGIRGRMFVPLFALVFTVIVVGGADLLLHYPMYTAILP